MKKDRPPKLNEENQIQGKRHRKKRQYNVEPVVLYAPRPDDAPQRTLGRVAVDAAVSDANVIAGRVSRERPDDAQTQQRNGAMGDEETSIVRLTDAAIVDRAIIAAVGPLSEHHVRVRRKEQCKLIAGRYPTDSPSSLA